MAEKQGAGVFKERVAFDQRINADDGYGNRQDYFVEAFTCHAGFGPMKGGEAVLAARLEGIQPINVRLRANTTTDAIRVDWRMRDLRDGAWADAPDNRDWSGPLYAIKSMIRTPDRKYVDLIVSSGVAA
jgi:head-tail adaptor